MTVSRECPHCLVWHETTRACDDADLFAARSSVDQRDQAIADRLESEEVATYIRNTANRRR